MVWNYMVTFVQKFPWGSFKIKGVIVDGKHYFHLPDAMRVACLTAPAPLVRNVEFTSGRRLKEIQTAMDYPDSCKLRKLRARYVDYEQLLILLMFGTSDFCIKMRKYALLDMPEERPLEIIF